MFTVMQKLRALRKALQGWNKEVFGDVNRNVELRKEELIKIQNEISTRGFSEALFAAESEAKKKEILFVFRKVEGQIQN